MTLNGIWTKRLKTAGLTLPLLGILCSLVAWIGYHLIDQRFVSNVQASEQHQQMLNKMDRDHKAFIQKLNSFQKEDQIESIELKLEIINVELSYLTTVSNMGELTPAQERRLEVLMTQERIYLERYEQLQ